MVPGRRAAIAAALAAAGAGGVSGESLARELGVSRVSVGKHVAALRSLGYTIEAVRRSGYRLVDAPDACIPEEVAWRLRDPLWVVCEGGPETGSTNDDAKRLARSGAPEGTVVVAARQVAGRGRLGREWVSPPGGAYSSVVLRPALPPAALGPAGLAVSVGVARALESFGVPAMLKWPNDVITTRGKLAGVLLETAAEADRVEWVVAGVGVNVAPSGEPGADDVRRHAPSARVPEVAAAVLDAVAAVYRVFAAEGFGALAGEYHARGALWGSEVVVREAGGAVVAGGTAEGVDATGALVLRDTGGVEHRVFAGEVTLRRD